jgi:ABC-2 type transport system permease protein
LLKVYLWKESLELKRDKKVILASVLLPLVVFPIIGLVIFATESTTPVFALVIQDPNASRYAQMAAAVITKDGGEAVFGNSTSAQAIIVFPPGFSQNVTNLSTPVSLKVVTLVSIGGKANQILNDVLYNLTLTVSYTRIEELANKANTTVNPALVWNPLKVERGFITIEHQAAKPSSAVLADVARLAAFLVFPGSTPVVFYVIEGILGERDRRTLEALLSTPGKLSNIIYSKLIIAILLGLLSSLGDLLGIGALLFLLNLTSGVSVVQVIGLVAFIVGISVANLLTASLITLVGMYLVGGSSKSFQLISLVVTSLGLLASFYALAFNPSFLNFPSSAVLVVPFVQFSASLMIYALGNVVASLEIFFVSLVVVLLLILFVTSKFTSERLLLK